VSQHALSINGKRRDITTDDFLSIARSMNIKKADQILQQIGKQVNNWNKFADEAGVARKIRKEIADTLVHLK
jgi:serine/threonine-protein kinase HipA